MKAKIKSSKQRLRKRRAFAIRKKIEGSAERPRLSVFRSARHIYAQLVDDISGKTLLAASTMAKDVRDQVKESKKSEAAEAVGKSLAEKAKAAGIDTIVFDRNGYPFHGRIAALAKGAREAGLKF